MLLMGYNGNLVIMPALSTKMPFDSVRDLTPVGLPVVSTNLLVSHPSLPVRSVKDLVALAKSRPGQINYASSGIGAVGHMAAELFKQIASIDMLHVPYRTSPEAISALLGKNVDVLFDTVSAVLGQVQGGWVAMAIAAGPPAEIVMLPEFTPVSAVSLIDAEKPSTLVPVRPVIDSPEKVAMPLELVVAVRVPPRALSCRARK